MHVGWTRGGLGVIPGLDDGHGPTSVHGDVMDYDEVQIAGDGELLIKSPYQTWKPEDTRVVTYVLAQERVPVRAGWTWMHNVKEARQHCTRRFGRILEENAAGDNVFFRVFKEQR